LIPTLGSRGKRHVTYAPFASKICGKSSGGKCWSSGLWLMKPIVNAMIASEGVVANWYLVVKPPGRFRHSGVPLFLSSLSDSAVFERLNGWYLLAPEARMVTRATSESNEGRPINAHDS